MASDQKEGLIYIFSTLHRRSCRGTHHTWLPHSWPFITHKRDWAVLTLLSLPIFLYLIIEELWGGGAETCLNLPLCGVQLIKGLWQTDKPNGRTELPPTLQHPYRPPPPTHHHTPSQPRHLPIVCEQLHCFRRLRNPDRQKLHWGAALTECIHHCFSRHSILCCDRNLSPLGQTCSDCALHLYCCLLCTVCVSCIIVVYCLSPLVVEFLTASHFLPLSPSPELTDQLQWSHI